MVGGDVPREDRPRAAGEPGEPVRGPRLAADAAARPRQSTTTRTTSRTTTWTTPSPRRPTSCRCIHGYDRTLKGMPAAPLPRAALPPMESEPVRVGRGGRGFEIELEDDDDLRLGSLESINLADNAVDEEALTRIHGATPTIRRSTAELELSALHAAPRREPGGRCRRWWPRWRRWSAPPAAGPAAAARWRPCCADKTQEVAAIAPARRPVISTPIDRPVGARRPAVIVRARPCGPGAAEPRRRAAQAPRRRRRTAPASSGCRRATSSCPPRTCWSTCRRPRRRPTSRGCTTWPSAWSRRCPTTA